MTANQISLYQKIVYESPKRVIVGEVLTFPEWRRGAYLVVFRGRDGIDYVGDLKYIHLVEELRSL